MNISFDLLHLEVLKLYTDYIIYQYESRSECLLLTIAVIDLNV